MSSGERPVRVGIVGLSASRGWAAGAHLPALGATEGLELRALVASSPESSRASAETHGVPLVFDSVDALAASGEVDLVVVAVRVPHHRELVLPALAAGTPVLCEWPLGRGLAEAEELTAAADGVRSFVGLQGRSAPAMHYVRDLVSDGYVGEVLSTTLVASSPVWGGTATGATEYLLDGDLGATLLTIPLGHAVDCLTMVLGEFSNVVATTAIRQPLVRNTQTDQVVHKTAEDEIAVSGILQGGAVASVHFRGGARYSSGLRWEINGTDGCLEILSEGVSLSAKIAISASRADGSHQQIVPPGRYDSFPQLAGQSSHAVAHAYAQIRQDLVDGSDIAPDFADARDHHRVLDAIRRAAATGQTQRLGIS